MKLIIDDIPDNATNGEVFGKIMDYMFMDDAYITTDKHGYLHIRGVKNDWWNASYKTEIGLQEENEGYSTVTEISHRTNAASETQAERANAIPPKIGDVYYEKHTVVGISKRTGTVSETDVEIVNVPPIEVLGKIRAEIEETKNNPLFNMVSKETIIEVIIEIIDKYREEPE